MVRLAGEDRASTPASTISGGFVPVHVASLMAAWRACRARPLGIGDFRTWLACHEARARRRGGGQGRAPNYSHAELARLLGVAEKRARASVNRLVAAGLIQWSESAIGFADPPPEPVGLEDTIGRGSGSVIVPRRILRHLVHGGRPALIAAALGVLLRCLSRRRSGFHARGRLKASWIAQAFGISLRQAKGARAQLVALGWIAQEPGDAWACNRWGRAYRIDLRWSPDPASHPSPAAQAGPSSTPLVAQAGPTSTPPDLQTQIPSGRDQHQEPADRGPAGARLAGQGGGIGAPKARWPRSATPPVQPDQPAPGPSMDGQAAPSKDLPAPRLDDVRPEDLRDAGRLLELHRQAVGRGLADPSEDGRLKFVAVAEHARVVGTTNPPGLFAALVRGGLWGHVTQADEDAARRKLREHLHGRALPAPAAPGRRVAARSPLHRPPVIGLSEDARLVKEVRAATIRAGIFRDPWPAFAARSGDWSRERWDAALMELGH